MAATHDGTANVTAKKTGGSTPMTISGKTTAGSNRVGIVAIAYYEQANTLASVTWNGVACDSIVTYFETNFGLRTSIYAIAAPPTAASDVVITGNGLDNFTCVVVISSYQDASQIAGSGKVSVTATAHTTAPTASPATLDIASNAAEIVIDCVAMAGDVFTVGAGQVELGNDHDTGGIVYGGSSYETGSATNTMSWTYSGTLNWTQVAVSLKAASGGTSIAPSVGSSSLTGAAGRLGTGLTPGAMIAGT